MYSSIYSLRAGQKASSVASRTKASVISSWIVKFLLELDYALCGIVQSLVYGTGVCAEFSGSVFRSLLEKPSPQHPNAQHSDNGMTYDNAIMALGKTCYFFIIELMKFLCLRQIFNGVFLKVNKATMNMLRRVEPYVTYGYPNLKSDLGKHKIICIEDLIHEIFTVGPYLKKANNFLQPFKLKAPLGGLKK
ncbi:hypothetical protein IEQ34_022755 [Dendrobium chrysotoxum]|uniref:Large ribosomal subunit protein uL30-like ferredoxin-like fold domain-containing protein n=1 Tax=Dendrobium chrysotoxum TaxID=161865 RepID=A0AAV7FZW5_DENCH|nr:hypothetical protein IEQ34_022755 [Dendrobium chrysotoxum]